MTGEEMKELKGLAASMGLYDDKHPCKRAVILGKAIKELEQEPCENAISRQAVLDKKELVELEDGQSFYCISPEDVETLSPVNPQPKTGKWIAQDIHNCHTDFKCSECGYIHSFMHLYGEPTADYTYCPNCGCRMVEPQAESEDEDGLYSL